MEQKRIKEIGKLNKSHTSISTEEDRLLGFRSRTWYGARVRIWVIGIEIGDGLGIRKPVVEIYFSGRGGHRIGNVSTP